MKVEARSLKHKSLNSLVLCIEHFNRPFDLGRTEAVLIFLDHAFEMFLKAAILHRGGKIRDKEGKNTISFDVCVRRGLSTSKVQFLTDEQALVLQAINGLRDAAQHHLVEINEGHLYLQAQAGITLYRDLLSSVFGEALKDMLPDRVLPISTIALVDPIALFAEDIKEVGRLLEPGRRRGTEATARLRALAILDGAMRGEKLQPSEDSLRELRTKIASGNLDINALFPGIAAVAFTSEGSGATINLRISKREGIPVVLVPEGTADSSVVSVKRVAELDYYNLRYSDLVDKLAITTNQVAAMIAILDIKRNEDFAKKFFSTWCYSQKALSLMRNSLDESPAGEWWQEYKRRGLHLKQSSRDSN